MSARIDTIVFDMGKVLVDFDNQASTRRIAQHSLRPFHEVERVLESDPDGAAYATGQMRCQPYFQRLARRLQFVREWGLLRDLWCSNFRPIDDNIELAARLRPHYRLAILSNNCPAYVEEVNRRCALGSIFHEQIYSYDVGAQKPGAAIFHLAQQVLKCDPARTVFIDNDHYYAEAAQRHVGWKAIHYVPDRDLEAALVKQGCAVPPAAKFRPKCDARLYQPHGKSVSAARAIALASRVK